ncbi:MAG: YpdA family putative bacillithiol disulfide reductase [Gemmatimonadota bacterium]|nr:YpdA family putative bacillithiol disulfide reductase [Gemmatimonadota bacterium]
MPITTVDLAIVGAGPCGLAAAVAGNRAGLSTIVFDRGTLVNGIASYPLYMSFFSTAERLSIGDVPFVIATEKPTRRDALAYYRAVASLHEVQVRQFETVEAIQRLRSDDARFGMDDDAELKTRPPRWQLMTRKRSGEACATFAHAVVVATGYFGKPNRLGGVPGELLPHVAYRYSEGHAGWHEDVVVVGGANSAVDVALDLYRAGARVTMVHFGAELDANVKPWVRPEIMARINEGGISARFNSRVVAIEHDYVVVRDLSVGSSGASGPSESRLPATQVYTMTGYQPETALLESAGVLPDIATGVPEHDRETMETPLAGLYIAGVIASGFDANKIFIENGRDHGRYIVANILAQTPSPDVL